MNNITIIFEDPWIRILNKPSQLHSVNNKSSTNTNSVASYLSSLDKKSPTYSDKPGDSGLINRLDFETSGAIISTKSRESWQSFAGLLKSGMIKKEYLILATGQTPQKIKIESYLGSHYRHAKKVRSTGSAPKKSGRYLKATTEFELIKYFKKFNVSLIRAIAGSARRHQIRVHAATMSAPLVGDSLYGSQDLLSEKMQGIWGQLPENLSEFPAFFLHANMLEFSHPFTGKEMIIKAPLPEEFALFAEYLLE